MPYLAPTATQAEPKEIEEPISVWIVKRTQTPLRFFFCNICRSGLFKYKGSVVSIIPGDSGDLEASGEWVANFPYYVRCYGHSPKYGKCPAIYIIQGYVEDNH
jgi:hypothetical protein